MEKAEEWVWRGKLKMPLRALWVSAWKAGLEWKRQGWPIILLVADTGHLLGVLASL